MRELTADERQSHPKRSAASSLSNPAVVRTCSAPRAARRVDAAESSELQHDAGLENAREFGLDKTRVRFQRADRQPSPCFARGRSRAGRIHERRRYAATLRTFREQVRVERARRCVRLIAQSRRGPVSQRRGRSSGPGTTGLCFWKRHAAGELTCQRRPDIVCDRVATLRQRNEPHDRDARLIAQRFRQPRVEFAARRRPS